ncbi:MAG: 16S rRNA (cytidine(1402)-2'-O)-methyltransferase [Ignavibacteriae bacterium]|nr:MAG: 16S rRNA (cytidine(1402)-2'-O)-methyltransferase [Ignavibacteriota bacterium]
MTKGNLYIVATPIGNLDDITFRAVQTLKDVDFIVCEDTRTTKILLNKYKITNNLISFNAQSEKHKLSLVINKILKGANCALVSDAGTPTISDPGVRLVNEAIKNDILVTAIPGANAAIAALSISGLPTDSFLFEGFLPQKKGRQKKLKELAEEERTIVLYESVYRIERLLKELKEYMPSRFVVIQREITKKFEECWSGYPNKILVTLSNKSVKGEFVVIIAPKKWDMNF